MAITISGGTRITNPVDPVRVTLGCTATQGGVTKNATIAIEFGGVECHAIQLTTMAEVVGGRPAIRVYSIGSGFDFTVTSDPDSPAWDLDTAEPPQPAIPATPTTPAIPATPGSPYYDSGYAGQMNDEWFTMVDSPSAEDPDGSDTIEGDYTSFEALTYCLSDKNVIGIVNWGVKKEIGKPKQPWAKLIVPGAVSALTWWNLLVKAQIVLDKSGFIGSALYVPLPGI
jgi:hypothetical protein